MKAPAASPPVIEMTGISVPTLRDARAEVIANVNWSVAPGDFWAVGGMHGTGKSDLVTLTAGLTSAPRGTYRLFGELMPIFDDARLAHRLRLGLVFDGGQLFNTLSVAENIALPLRYHRDLEAEVQEKQVRGLLETTGLMPWAHRMPGALQRHWRKRVGLARALALKPEVLLLDNPLGGLDARQGTWWLSFLDQLATGHDFMQGKPMTIVVMTDDLRPWQNRARQFALVREREFVVIGSQQKLQASGAGGDALVRDLLTGTASTD